MEAVFLSKTDVYNGNYSITKRDATYEFPKEMHYHDFYEMQFYLCESEGEKVGETTIDGKTRELTQGCMALINMFDMHQINITCKIPYTRYYIPFDSSLLLFICSNASNLFNIFSCYTDVKYSQPLTPAQIATFMSIYNKYEHLTVRHRRDTMEKSPILEIFTHVYDIFYDRQGINATDSGSLAVITELVSYIDANITGDPSLERLTEHMNFDAFHLSRMFKRYTGTTLNKYVITKQIDRAKLSLRSQVPITTVSKEVGFNNYNHFYRTFKSVTGINPVKHREIMEEEK